MPETPAIDQKEVYGSDGDVESRTFKDRRKQAAAYKVEMYMSRPTFESQPSQSESHKQLEIYISEPPRLKP